MYYNAQGAKNKFAQCSDLVTTYKPAVFALAETKFVVINDVFQLCDYCIISEFHANKGVSIWVHKKFWPQLLVFPMQLQQTTAIAWSLLHVQNRTIAAGCIYCTQEGSAHRQTENNVIYANLVVQINYCQMQSYHVFLMGDFNGQVSTNLGLWWNQGQVNQNGRQFLNFFDHVDLKLLNAMPNSLW